MVIIYFNSSMVQLLALLMLFVTIVIVFQFQYGAIISLSRVEGGDETFVHFNSSMVQLLVRCDPVRQASIHHFNSSMVQLLVAYPALEVDVPKFQFQYGAIIRKKLGAEYDAYQHFNSSMVQLLVYDTLS